MSCSSRRACRSLEGSLVLVLLALSSGCLVRRERTISLVAPAAAADSLEIIDWPGPITVTASSTSELRVNVRLAAHAPTGGMAERALDGTRVVLAPDPLGIVRLSLHRTGFIEAEAVVTVPPSLALRIDGGAGDVSIGGSRAPIAIDRVRGTLTLRETTGAISAKTGRGALVLAPLSIGWDGSIDARTRDGPIELSLPPGGGIDLDARTESGTVTLRGCGLPSGAAVVVAPLLGGGPSVRLETRAGLITVIGPGVSRNERPPGVAL